MKKKKVINLRTLDRKLDDVFGFPSGIRPINRKQKKARIKKKHIHK